MNAPVRYHSNLREAQAAATRQQILDAMAQLIERGVEPTYAAIAKQAGVQERTVYRYFPSKDELYEAFWWMVHRERVGSPGFESQDLTALLEAVGVSFRGFDQHQALVSEMLHSKHGLQIRLRTNDKRQAMFRRVVKRELPDADAVTLRRAAAVTQLLYSAMAWFYTKAYWEMDGDEAAASVAQALTAMFRGLRESKTKRRR